MSAGEEPTPPAPLPKGKGESETRSLTLAASERASGGAERSEVSVSPFPLGRGAGGVCSSRRLALLAAAVGVIAVGVWYFALRGPRDDLGRLQGEWRLTVAGRAGQFPITVRVRGDRWTYLVGGQEQKRYALALRPDADPKEIDLVQLGPDDQPLLEKHERGGAFTPVTLRGIYAIEDGKMKVLTAPSPLPRPTTFDTPDGPPVWLLEKL